MCVNRIVPSVTQPPQVRKLADFNENCNTATLWDETLAGIIEQGLESLPVIVISIGGVARSGKSFLLNVLVSYLSYIEQESKHIILIFYDEQIKEQCCRTSVV